MKLYIEELGTRWVPVSADDLELGMELLVVRGGRRIHGAVWSIDLPLVQLLSQSAELHTVHVGLVELWRRPFGPVERAPWWRRLWAALFGGRR